MRSIAIIVALVAISGCATQAKFQAKMDRFVGQPEAAVVGTYGPPQNSYILNDGTKVLQYTRGGTMVIPGATTYQPVTTNTAGNVTLNQGMRTTTGTYNQTSTTYLRQQGPAIPINLSCTVNFTVDKEGVVRRWSAEGNHCVSKG
ncbi:MAG TPA: hypothetical protein VIE67_05690 [Rudaea sp.]|jgi:hypothetical protein|uniref:hypothetical protein n=1 Tax=Rudaea sp. TaxID=2136325 RepID=UPI002F93555B